MSYWGKVVGGVAGFAVGGPFGAVMGAALGHAADNGAIDTAGLKPGGKPSFLDGSAMHPARIASLFTPKEHLFALSVVSLAAKLARCDGPVNRTEIDAFKRHFRIPPESARNVGRLFDQARSSAEAYEPYAVKLGEAFSDNRGLLEDVLAGLFGVAGAQGPGQEAHQPLQGPGAPGVGLPGDAWDRVRQGQARTASGSNDGDPYAVLGVARNASDDVVRAAWKNLMRQNHPDSLASRGVPADFIARASAKVAGINAAWDRIKRDRGI